jgi:predicted DNA-binding transcriptional regulator AlpA
MNTPLSQIYNLSNRDVGQQLGMSPRNVDMLVKARRFPPPVRLSTNVRRWSQQDVDDYSRRCLLEAGRPIPA